MSKRNISRLKQEIARLNRKVELLEKTYMAERINGMMPEFKEIEKELEECYKGEYEEEDDDTINRHKKHEEESHLKYLKFKLKKRLLNKGDKDDNKE